MFLQPNTGYPECVVTEAHEIEALWDILHMPALRECTVVDGWAGTGSIAAACCRAQIQHVIQADINPRSPEVLWSDSLQFSHVLKVVQGLTDFVHISSPWWTWNDVAIPLMLKSGAMAVFAHVSSTYETNAPLARAQFFNGLGSRVHTQHMVKPGQVGRPSSWICIFRSDADRRRLLKLQPSGATRHWSTSVSAG